ncbi:MAG: hypothetical protein JOZ19_04405 [Rubrobacter sp.]|nr:hypothetical protein [Rubrobacter sp.]
MDPEVCYPFEGWGTSLAWWAERVGGWPEDKKSAIADLVFDPSKGLGFNVVRYNIGAGEVQGQGCPTSFHPGAQVPTFEPSEGKWNWEADASQRDILQKAKDRGANIFEAWADSPPTWMTLSGCSSGNNQVRGGDNLPKPEDDSHTQVYEKYAYYLATVVEHFRDYWGIEFRTVEPLNEPHSPHIIWPYSGCASNKASSCQEGANFQPSTQKEIIRKVCDALSEKELNTRVSAPDENTVDATIESYRSYDPTAKDCISQINTHGYWITEPYKGNKRGELWDLARKEGKTLWMSEFGTGRKPDKEANDTASALRLSRQILDDMQQMHPRAWVYWQAVHHDLPYGEGLISVDDPARLTSDCRYICTKRYYAMANYSRFIRPGYQIIGSDDPNALVAYDPSSGTLVIVTTNDTEEDTYFTYDLSNFGGVESSTVKAYRTSDTEDLTSIASPLPEDITPAGFRTTAGFRSYTPRESITTYIISDVYPSSRLY